MHIDAVIFNRINTAHGDTKYVDSIVSDTNINVNIDAKGWMTVDPTCQFFYYQRS